MTVATAPAIASVIIDPIARAHPAAVEALLDEAFGVDRHARTAYRIRRGVAAVAELSFAALHDELLIGTLQSWPIEIVGESGGVPLVLVGPVAVAPARQGMGVGRLLMDRLVATAPAVPMAMIGDPDYYERWGFTAASTADWEVPGPVERHRLLARSGDRLPRTGALGPGQPPGFALADVAA